MVAAFDLRGEESGDISVFVGMVASARSDIQCCIQMITVVRMSLSNSAKRHKLGWSAGHEGQSRLHQNRNAVSLSKDTKRHKAAWSVVHELSAMSDHCTGGLFRGWVRVLHIDQI